MVSHEVCILSNIGRIYKLLQVDHEGRCFCRIKQLLSMKPSFFTPHLHLHSLSFHHPSHF
ncbi:hypothetical protein Sjap_016084 [Stephania japonica]|uniref:Uncharacterized protein n=1 Tax=Stephania japonica TaxID=461633 RepID=A0AAP0IMB4_9MAGN